MWFKIFKQANNEIMASFKETVKTNILPIILTVLGLLSVVTVVLGGIFLISILVDMVFVNPGFAIPIFVFLAGLYAITVISYAAALTDKMRSSYYKFKRDQKEIYQRLSE